MRDIQETRFNCIYRAHPTDAHGVLEVDAKGVFEQPNYLNLQGVKKKNRVKYKLCRFIRRRSHENECEKSHELSKEERTVRVFLSTDQRTAQ